MDKNEFLEKDEAHNMAKGADLSSAEDLSIGVMNLVSIEEHLYFTMMKTGKEEYSTLLGETRGMRIELMRELIGQPEGEVWCVSKHLLASTMRLIEVGTKYLKMGRKVDADMKFDYAFRLYSIFWKLNLEKGAPEREAVAQAGIGIEDRRSGENFVAKLKHMIDCCKE